MTDLKGKTMRGAILLVAAIGAFVGEGAAFAQEDGVDEIVVTATRRSEGDDDSIPAIGLRKRGDFLVQRYTIVSDTREPAQRREEVYATLGNLIAEATKNPSIAIAVGGEELQGVTRANYRAIALDSNFRNRADTSHLSVFVKHRLAPDGSNARSAVGAIESFAKAVKVAGRSEVLPQADTQISIVDPQQYRYQILKAVTDDAARIASSLGADYGVTLGDFVRPVEWIGESPTEVFLFIRYDVSIAPMRK